MSIKPFIGYNGIVLSSYKKSLKIAAFTLSEVLVTLLIMAFIFAAVITGMKFLNHTEKGLKTLSDKTLQNIDSTLSQIMLHDCVYDDFSKIKFNDDYFSLEDNNASEKFSKLFQKYLKSVDTAINYNDKYFSNAVVDYKKNPVGINLKDNYNNFFVTQDGILIGFRFYDNCKAAENNAVLPSEKQRFSIDNVCASIFYDVNGIQKPNKLGYDEFIVPIDEKGIKYE